MPFGFEQSEKEKEMREEMLQRNNKTFVSVTYRHTVSGQIIPLSFRLEDAYEINIDKVINVKPVKSLKSGGSGIRYSILIQGRSTYLFFDTFENRWFIEEHLENFAL